MNSATPRPRIADIIRASGKMGPDPTGASQDQLAAIASAITGGPAGTFVASQALTDEIAKRFPKLNATSSVERDFEAPYETTGRALVLALQACGVNIAAAFDTESGATLEVKKSMTILAPAFTLNVAIADRGVTTHFVGQAQHTGLDWGQNAKLLNAVFDKTAEYLQIFKS